MENLDYNLIKIFPKVIYSSEVEICDYEKNFIKNGIGLREDYQSNGSIIYLSKSNHVLDSKELVHLKSILLKHVNKFLKEIFGIADKIEFYIKTSWIALYKENSSGDRHNHKNSIITGILYVDVDDAEGDIVFYEDECNTPSFLKNFLFNFSEENQINSNTFQIKPKNNKLYLFESGLVHSISSNTTTNPRIALAFDVFFKGTITANSLGELTLY